MFTKPLIALLLVILGCGGSSTAPADQYALAAATYNLTGIGVLALPDTVVSGADIKLFYSGAVALVGDKKNHRYFQHLNFQQLPQSGAPNLGAIVENGTYELAGSTITFHIDNGTTHSGTLRGGFITSASGNLALIFVRPDIILLE